jgi:hypothetical protein
MIQRPDLTAGTPAVDGIAKPERNYRQGEDCMDNPVTYCDRAERPIRPDVLAVMAKSDSDFDLWYQARYDAICELQRTYLLVGDVPDLGNGSSSSTFAGHLCLRSVVETLGRARDHLELIKARREEIKRTPWGSL